MKTIETLAAELVATVKKCKILHESSFAQLEAALNSRRLANPAELHLARRCRVSDELRVDDQAPVIRVSPNESWVQAWVKVDAETLPVRDGYVCKADMVWWRHHRAPEHVRADDGNHWNNIRDFPYFYQIAKPTMRLVYED